MQILAPELTYELQFSQVCLMPLYEKHLDLMDTTNPMLLLNVYSQPAGTKHSGPQNMRLFFTGTTNILFGTGGHAVTM